MADVFISYVKTERALTAALAKDIERAGFTVWWDRELLPNDDFQREISCQLDACKAAVVVWTPESVKSIWVRSEAQHAQRQNKLINTHWAKLDVTLIPKPFDVINSAPTTDRAAIIKAVRKLAGPTPIPVRPEPDRRRSRYSARGLAISAAAGVLIAAVSLFFLAWLATRPGPAPTWALARSNFISEPIAFQWSYDEPRPNQVLFELKSYKKLFLGLFEQEVRQQIYADGREKEIPNVNDVRFWQVRAVDGQTKDAVSAWSMPISVSQYDSVYDRIRVTREMRVGLSKSQNQGIFKWIDDDFHGFEIKLVEAVRAEISRDIGHPIETVFLTEEWSQLLRAPSEGRADLIVSSITSREYRNRDFKIEFSRPYYCTGFSLIHRPGLPTKAIREAISGQRVGVQADTTGARLAEALKSSGATIVGGYTSPQSIATGVRDGRIEFGLTDTPFAVNAKVKEPDRFDYDVFSGSDFPDSFPLIDRTQEYAIAVRSDASRLLRVIDKTIEGMERSGELVAFLRAAAREFDETYHTKTASENAWITTDRPWECGR